MCFSVCVHFQSQSQGWGKLPQCLILIWPVSMQTQHCMPQLAPTNTQDDTHFNWWSWRKKCHRIIISSSDFCHAYCIRKPFLKRNGFNLPCQCECQHSLHVWPPSWRAGFLVTSFVTSGRLLRIVVCLCLLMAAYDIVQPLQKVTVIGCCCFTPLDELKSTFIRHYVCI